MVRLISYGRESFVTDNFLVVEVAIFPHTGKVYDVRANRFSLRVNGKKEALFAQSPGMVIASVKYPDWQTQTGRRRRDWCWWRRSRHRAASTGEVSRRPEGTEDSATWNRTRRLRGTGVEGAANVTLRGHYAECDP